MKVDAVVLNWKRPDETIACVASLREHAPDVHMIVVDNASRDGSVEKIRKAHLGVVVLENFGNLGYAGGNNVGIRAALQRGSDAVLVLNNDVVVTQGCVQTLVDELRHHDEWGIVAPLSLKRDDPGIVDFWRAKIDARNFAVHAVARDTRDMPEGAAETDYATGSALLIRSELLRNVGLFDERYFLVWEDVDLCLRARRAGARIGVTADARVLHGRSVSFGGDQSPLFHYFFVRNSFLLASEHEELFKPRARLPLNLRRPADARALLERRYRGWLQRTDTSQAMIQATARGLEDGLAGRFGPAPDDLMPA